MLVESKLRVLCVTELNMVSGGEGGSQGSGVEVSLDNKNNTRVGYVHETKYFDVKPYVERNNSNGNMSGGVELTYNF